MKNILLTLVIAFAAAGVTLSQTGGKSQKRQPASDGASAVIMTQVPLINEVRHELLTLPYYGVFDWIDFEVSADGTAVTLNGQVVNPGTKSNAGLLVGKISSVTQVNNRIKVLPLSPLDDQLRKKVFRAIYNFDSPLFRYSIQAVPPIHIIVDRGQVTLKGVVASKGDSNLANISANGVPGVFKVTNELQVESGVR